MSSGLTDIRMHRLSFPVVEVASSAAKQLIESPMIAEAVVQKLSAILPMSKEESCLWSCWAGCYWNGYYAETIILKSQSDSL